MKLKSLLSVAVLPCAIVISINSCSKAATEKDTQEIAKEAVASDKVQDRTGQFTADGKAYSGKVSTQLFPETGQFSVLCQDDSDPNNSRLIQFVFQNEASARAAGDRKVAYNQGKDQTAEEVSVTYDTRYSSDQGRAGTLSVTGGGKDNELVFENVELQTMSKEKVTVSGKIPF